MLPDWQRRGIGTALVEAGLQRLQRIDAAGCVVVGDPAYYARFGFAHDSALRYPGFRPEVFQVLLFEGERPTGVGQDAPAGGGAHRSGLSLLPRRLIVE